MSAEHINRIVIIGGGFGGLNAAIGLGKRGFNVTLIDRENYHLFQPLLYQVATGFLTPGDIAATLRSSLARYPSVTVIRDEVKDLQPSDKAVIGKFGHYSYDVLIVAAGMTTSYFGNEAWSEHARGLKTMKDSLKLRSRVLSAFEAAERSESAKERERLLTFVIVGGGPTGVELAGALSELARQTLKSEFRKFNPADCRIILLEGGVRLLSSFSEKTSAYTRKSLEQLGVLVQTDAMVKNVSADHLEVMINDELIHLPAQTIIWAAGVKAESLSGCLKERYSASLDNSGRVYVDPQLNVPGDKNVFVIGDMARFEHELDAPLPGLAPVAIQQGRYVARLLEARRNGMETGPFRYRDKGNMAVIGKGRAVAETGRLKLFGLPAWIAWAFVHIYFLIEFENKIVVFLRWAWNYITNKRGSRLIT